MSNTLSMLGSIAAIVITGALLWFVAGITVDIIEWIVASIKAAWRREHGE